MSLIRSPGLTSGSQQALLVLAWNSRHSLPHLVLLFSLTEYFHAYSFSSESCILELLHFYLNGNFQGSRGLSYLLFNGIKGHIKIKALFMSFSGMVEGTPSDVLQILTGLEGSP